MKMSQTDAGRPRPAPMHAHEACSIAQVLEQGGSADDVP
jgi:hypothetical protein